VAASPSASADAAAARRVGSLCHSGVATSSRRSRFSPLQSPSALECRWMVLSAAPGGGGGRQLRERRAGG
jgi:hypothetical protein